MENQRHEMKFREQLDQTRQWLFSFWAARNAREQKILVAGLLTVGLGLAYALLINPALSGRSQLNNDLPMLRQQVARMQALSKEASSLSARTASQTIHMSKENIEAAFARNGLQPQSVMLSGDYAKVQLASASFSGMLNCLDDLQKNMQVSVADAKITALDKPGMVNASLTLQQPGRD